MSADQRAAHRRIARHLGYPAAPEDMPWPSVSGWRSSREIADRALVLDVIISCAHGLEVGPAWMWLERTRLSGAVTSAEREYLDELESGLHLDDLARRLQVEALWALLWSLGFAPALDYSEGCGSRVAPLLPALDDHDGPRRFRAEAERRDPDELEAALDLVRVLADGLGDGEVLIGFSPGAVEPYVVWERRRALEWLAGADWE